MGAVNFPFKEGDRVRLNNWVPESSVVIKTLGDEGFLYDGPDGERYITFDVTYKGQKRVWSLHPERLPYPEMWIAVLPTRCVRISHRTSSAADPDVLGVIHLFPNGTLTMEDPS